MKTFAAFAGVVLFAVLMITPVSAQQPGPSSDPHHPGSQAAPAPGPGVKGGAMPMMDMCRQMMGDMTAMPPMGAGAPADPKERADMLQMRGEMMKAMGEIMMRHAGRMQGMMPK